MFDEVIGQADVVSIHVVGQSLRPDEDAVR